MTTQARKRTVSSITTGDKVWQGKKSEGEWAAVNGVTDEVVPLAGKKRRWLGKHVILFQEMLLRVALEHALSGEALRVLLYACAVLDWDNWVVLRQRPIADALGISQPNVSRCLRRMLALGILVRPAHPAPRGVYRLNSYFAYKGTYAGLQRRRREELHEHIAQGAKHS